MVSALSIDLGTITSTIVPVSWAVGYVRNPSVQYTAYSGKQQERAPYYVSQYSTIDQVVKLSFPLSCS